MHTTKVRKTQHSDCGHHASEKRCTSSCQPSKLFAQQGDTKERTPSCQRHTTFKLYQNFEGNWQANATQQGSFPSMLNPAPSFPETRTIRTSKRCRAVHFPQPRNNDHPLAQRNCQCGHPSAHASASRHLPAPRAHLQS